MVSATQPPSLPLRRLGLIRRGPVSPVLSTTGRPTNAVKIRPRRSILKPPALVTTHKSSSAGRTGAFRRRKGADRPAAAVPPADESCSCLGQGRAIDSRASETGPKTTVFSGQDQRKNGELALLYSSHQTEPFGQKSPNPRAHLLHCQISCRDRLHIEPLFLWRSALWRPPRTRRPHRPAWSVPRRTQVRSGEQQQRRSRLHVYRSRRAHFLLTLNFDLFTSNFHQVTTVTSDRQSHPPRPEASSGSAASGRATGCRRA